MLGLGLGMGVGNGSGLMFVGSGPIASAPSADSYPTGAMWWDTVTGTAYVDSSVSKHFGAIDALCPSYNLTETMCFVKHRNDYKEFSVYVPIDATGTKFTRLYFSNRLNLGKIGFPRLTAATYASLTGTIGVDEFTQSNVATHVASIASILDMIVGSGNVEYAIKTRKASGETEDFVSGIHGAESLDSFIIKLDGVAVDYSTITTQTKLTCKKFEFEAKTRVGYPSDKTNYWMEIVYTGVITRGNYSVNVTTNVIQSSEVYIEYAGLLMAPGSTSTQKYATGFGNFVIENGQYVLNEFNNTINNISGFSDASLYNGSAICHASFPSYSGFNGAYLTNKNIAGRYTSRTDKFNKCYLQSTDEGWRTIAAGYGINVSSSFDFRAGDASAYNWSDDSKRKIWRPV